MNGSVIPPPTPFRPKQQRADMTPIARWNPCTAKFLTICDSQPPLTSCAACARYRLGRKTTDHHLCSPHDLTVCEKSYPSYTQTSFALLNTPITFLTPPATLSVIQDATRASGLCRTLCAAFTAHPVPGHSILPLDLDSAHTEALDVSLPPLVDPDGFLVD
ncbi:hypothetical protein C8F04DRAFT_1256791 [Mycena alexandri]|uniref:Uncharacterized protein n=1 Tax=Mycena alexandri TaxID=1745969 RepID=A0AAD6T0U6_9AGAR|nr:hypothetical protein C8F04DRAFT_1256791 [Mycena alexandri]